MSAGTLAHAAFSSRSAFWYVLVIYCSHSSPVTSMPLKLSSQKSWPGCRSSMMPPGLSSLIKWWPLPMVVNIALCFSSISSGLIKSVRARTLGMPQYRMRSSRKIVADLCCMHTFQMQCMSLYQAACGSLIVTCLCRLTALAFSLFASWVAHPVQNTCIIRHS